MKKILKSILLKSNHIIFWWYYKRVPKFFHRWTILRSVDLLKQNYEHQEYQIESKDKLIAKIIKHSDETRKELSNLRMQMIATGSQIKQANKMFGTDFKSSSEN